MSRGKWDTHFLNLCKEVASMSRDPSTKTGCVVVRPDKSIASTGFNGFPRGVDDNKEKRYERPFKYLFTEHAERNAIITAARHGVSLEGCTIYVTGPPCAECTRTIIQSGINEVVWPEDNPFEKNLEVVSRWKDSLTASHEMMEEAGVWTRRVSSHSLMEER
jgi:dCMP deaminase